MAFLHLQKNHFINLSKLLFYTILLIVKGKSHNLNILVFKQCFFFKTLFFVEILMFTAKLRGRKEKKIERKAQYFSHSPAAAQPWCFRHLHLITFWNRFHYRSSPSCLSSPCRRKALWRGWGCHRGVISDGLFWSLLFPTQKGGFRQWKDVSVCRPDHSLAAQTAGLRYESWSYCKIRIWVPLIY